MVVPSYNESYYPNATPYFITSDHPNFTAHLNTTAEPPNFILPWWRQVIWSLLFAGMVIVATVGNLVVIWIVLANKRMRTVTNYFLVNLSVADAMVSTLNVTFNYTYMLFSDWPFGTLYCKVSQFIAVLSISASVFTLMAISVDRYVAIIWPLRPRLGKRATLAIAAAIWLLSSLLSSPNLIFFTTFTEDRGNGDVRFWLYFSLQGGSAHLDVEVLLSLDGAMVCFITVCYAEWPDGPTNFSNQEYIYNVAFMVLTYFLPIAMMSFTYAWVGKELWGSQSIGECTQRQMDNVKSKRRVVKMMIVVVVIFAVCWLPFHIYFIVTSYYPDVTSYLYIQEIYLAIYWLAMSNSVYNPIIYCWMNSKFRRGFKQFFWCCGALGGRGLARRGALAADHSVRCSRSVSPTRKSGTIITMHSGYSTVATNT